MMSFLQHTISVLNIHNGEQGTITADNYPFSSIEPYHAEARSDKVKGKDVTGDEDAPVTVPTRHPLARFTRQVTSLECGTIDTYHHVEVRKKGGAKKLIIFDGSGDMDRHVRHNEEDGAGTSVVIPDGR